MQYLSLRKITFCVSNFAIFPSIRLSHVLIIRNNLLLPLICPFKNNRSWCYIGKSQPQKTVHITLIGKGLILYALGYLIFKCSAILCTRWSSITRPWNDFSRGGLIICVHTTAFKPINLVINAGAVPIFLFQRGHQSVQFLKIIMFCHRPPLVFFFHDGEKWRYSEGCNDSTNLTEFLSDLVRWIILANCENNF